MSDRPRYALRSAADRKAYRAYFRNAIAHDWRTLNDFRLRQRVIRAALALVRALKGSQKKD